MPHTLSIALLVADTPPSAVVAARGDYTKLYTTFFNRSLSTIKRHSWQEKFELDIRPFDVVHAQHYPDEGQLADGLWDAIVITGSAHAVYSGEPWVEKLLEFVRRVGKEHPLVRIMGICWGHQAIARAFGGHVAENPAGWELGVYDCELSEDGEEVWGFTKWDREGGGDDRVQEVGGDADPDAPQRLRVQQCHKDAVLEMPDALSSTSFLNLASTPACAIQSLALKYPTDAPPIPSRCGSSSFIAFDTHTTESSSGPSPPRGLQILTLQGHPEFDTQILELLIEAKTEMGPAPREIKQEALQRARRADDALKIGRRMLCMLGVEEARDEGGDAM